MADWRKLIRHLASDKSVLAGNVQVAERVRDRAAQIDPDGKFQVVTDTLTVNGLPRLVAVVVNTSPDAARNEFGTAGTGRTGRSGLRPLGRAASSVKG